MKITDNKVVVLHYAVSDSEDTLIDSSYDHSPLAVIQGSHYLIPGLEEALVDHQAGDKFEVTLTPEQAYGERREGALQRIPLKHLQGLTKGKKWAADMTAVVESNQGRNEVTLIKVGRFNADCDLNHPFAGKTLTFAVEIISVRAATEDELSHGHAHAKDGCGH